jgi:hypothetical protein
MNNLKGEKLKTNWKYLLIVIILAFIVGGGILIYGHIVQEETKMPEIKISKPNYATPETKDIITTPPKKKFPTGIRLEEKKIPKGLGSIFSKEMNKDLVGRESYYSDEEKKELPPEYIEKPPTDIDCLGSKSIDLNTDGIEEFIIFPGWFCESGIEIRGASGGGPIYIFQKVNEEWKIIGKLKGSMINIETGKTGGYYDLTTFWPLGAGSAIIYFYQWEENILSYELKKSEETEVGL